MAPLEDRQLQTAIVRSFLFDATFNDCPFWSGPTLRGSVGLYAVIHTRFTACNMHTQLASVEQNFAIYGMQGVI